MKITTALVATLLVLPVNSFAQTAPTTVFGTSTNIFSSAADVRAAIAKARALHKRDNTAALVPIITLGPYVMNIEYRTGQTSPTIHTGLSELMYVLEGSAVLHQGGRLVGGKGVPELIVGTAITGDSNARTISKGDFIVVPPNTPHQFSPTKTPFIIVSVHVPTPVLTPKANSRK